MLNFLFPNKKFPFHDLYWGTIYMVTGPTSLQQSKCISSEQ